MTLGPLRQKDSDFRQGMVKIQSLDFGTSVDDREREAHLYRVRLLEAQKQKQQRQQKQQQPVSKIGEGLRKKKEKQALAVEGGGVGGGGGESGHGLPDYGGGEKASFGQCAFNMANILMVSDLVHGLVKGRI